MKASERISKVTDKFTVESVFSGNAISLDEILDCRDWRASTIELLLYKERQTKSGGNVLSFKLNIPGPIKQSHYLREAFNRGLEELWNHFGTAIVYEKIIHQVTGSEYFAVISGDGMAVKSSLVSIESTHPLGRLFDLDLHLSGVGEGVDGPLSIVTPSRSDLGLPPRTCLICGDDAKTCGRSRSHDIDSLRTAIVELLKSES